MKVLKLRLTMALIAGLMMCGSAQALTYNYSYTFDSSQSAPGIVSGSFDGVASGNLSEDHPSQCRTYDPIYSVRSRQ